MHRLSCLKKFRGQEGTEERGGSEGRVDARGDESKYIQDTQIRGVLPHSIQLI